MLPSKFTFNQEYAIARGCSNEDLEYLQYLYDQMDRILDNPLIGELRNYKDAVAQIEEIEFKLQKTWKFEQDSAKHSYWYEVKGCLCPKLDNSDAMYSGRRIINNSCPFHGELK
jgi:hypothetical protein